MLSLFSIQHGAMEVEVEGICFMFLVFIFSSPTSGGSEVNEATPSFCTNSVRALLCHISVKRNGGYSFGKYVMHLRISL